MEKLVLLLAFTLTVVGAIAQPDYEKNMYKAFQLWEEGNPDEASALFERIATVETAAWLPNYYVALVNTTTAFESKDEKRVNALLTKAQTALDVELAKHPNNAELLVVQAMIHTAWIAFDPMTNGQKLSPVVSSIYAKAEKIAPQNPRVVFSKAQFALGSAQYFGTDTSSICSEIEKSLELFDTFKPESDLHPNWGKEFAEETLANCK